MKCQLLKEDVIRRIIIDNRLEQRKMAFFHWSRVAKP